MAIALVTGATGWLGRRLVEALAHGLADAPAPAGSTEREVVRCLLLPSDDPASLRRLDPRVETAVGDLRDPAALRAFMRGAEGGTLFHCAGVVHPRRSVREFTEINLIGTRTLLEAARAAGVRRAVVVSSNSPIGVARRADIVFDESSPYNPYMGYGRSKMLMELSVHEVQERGELEAVIIRPPWFYGPGQPVRQTLFFTMIRTGRVPVVGSGENRRSMAYIDNLCQGLLLAERVPDANGRTYWIADRRPYSINEIIGTVERLLEEEFGFRVAHRRMRLPAAAGEFATRADALIQRLGLYHQKVHVLSEMNKTIACSVAKAEQELGYRPTVELEEGMRRSIRWCIRQGIEI